MKKSKLDKESIEKENKSNMDIKIKLKKEENLMMIRAINFSFISSFNNKIIAIQMLNSIINAHLIKFKIFVYTNLLSYYYDTKDNDNYINIRKLLSHILLKKLINKKYNTLRYYFYKFRSNAFSLYLINEKANLNKFNESLLSDKYEEMMSKISKENTKELMKLSNENLLLRADINKLNEELENYRKKEININSRIKEIKSQYNNFQKIIENMNIKLENLKQENISYKNKYDSINNKYLILSNEYEQMKIKYDNNKNEFETAIKEMDTYSQLLLTLEKKMNKAELDKKKAESERDKAILETRNIRERYINIMSNNNNI